MIDLERYKSAEWSSAMPTLQRVVEATGIESGALAAPMLHNSAVLAELATGRTWLRHQQRTDAAPAGAPQLAAFTTYVDKLGQLPAISGAWTSTAASLSNAFEGTGQIQQAVIEAQVAMVSKLFASAASDIPILNMVIGFVALGVNVGRTIWAENAAAKPAKVLPLELDPAEDTARGRQLLDAAATDDWTELFLPYHDSTQSGGWLNREMVDYGSGYKGGRFWFGSQAGQITPLGQGLVPGGGVARLWQYRGKKASTGWTGLDRVLRALNLPIAAGKDFERYTTYGVEYFRPSMEQVGQVLWSEVTTPGPTMFKVDAVKLRDHWQRYWGVVLQALYQTVSAGEEGLARLLMNVLLGGNGASFPDWPHPYATMEVVAQVPEKYRDLLPYSMVPTGKTLILGGGVTVEERFPDFSGIGWWVTRRGTTLRYIDNLEAAQRHALGRLTVAYLTGDEPALGSGELFELWKSRRAALLHHPGLSHVDFDRVPKTDYTGTGEWRKKAIDKKIKGLKGITFMEASAPKILTPRFAWGVGELPTKKATKKPQAFEKSTIDQDGEGGGLVAVAALAALGLSIG